MTGTHNELVESINRLAATDPNGSMVDERVMEVLSKIAQVRTALDPAPSAPSAPPTSQPEPAPTVTIEEPASVIDQIDAIRSAAAAPAERYNRVVSIMDGLRHAALLAQRPQNAAIRPRVASIVEKIAGVFAEIDTVKDLDKPLEQIESAVHSLYNGGKLNSPKTYMFEQRGVGHRSKKTEG